MLAPAQARGGYGRLEAKWLRTPPPWPFPGHPKKSRNGKEKGEGVGVPPVGRCLHRTPLSAHWSPPAHRVDARKHLPRRGFVIQNPGAHDRDHRSSIAKKCCGRLVQKLS